MICKEEKSHCQYSELELHVDLIDSSRHTELMKNEIDFASATDTYLLKSRTQKYVELGVKHNRS